MASGLTPLLAVIVSGYEPLVFAAGVPDRVAVPSPLSLKLTPLGSGPDSLIAAVGLPVVVMVELPASFSSKVAESLDVMLGASSTVSRNDCMASGLMPFEAVIVSG